MFRFLKGKSKKVLPVPPNFHAEAVDELLKEMDEPIPQDEVDKRAEKLKKEWLKKHSGGGRLMSKKYCRKTPCRRMGFTQKASCRPYKNCYTRRR